MWRDSGDKLLDLEGLLEGLRTRLDLFCARIAANSSFEFEFEFEFELILFIIHINILNGMV